MSFPRSDIDVFPGFRALGLGVEDLALNSKKLYAAEVRGFGSSGLMLRVFEAILVRV